ncbi:Sugar or nucleoside kinase, ribokinase family [Sanguibacter gelidistatuariae]|uniref:Sugar or nucleoside kinase, ribokinase family n=1 Tax=Sanguibacter gelidistatuariae TaxID=1814289 RepID=A0A1G6T994_9MICO|nr:PfkB family carbohydrate kinase [Sanguibacter gelidistatuariae]SDD25414.1 Sugar or nucleoside kinase, ribokinase family [Sanguibacter gelidistatuariae]
MTGIASRLAPVGVFVGLTTLDVIHRSRCAPGPDEKMTAERQDLAAGGPAANAAVVFAALGGRPRLVTALGDGPAAAIARADLEAHGVEVVDLAQETAMDLGVSAIRVDALTGSRSVLSMDAAAHDLAAPEDIGRLFDGCEVALFDGHHPRVASPLAEAARAQGIPVVIDAGRWKPVMAELIPAATTVIASADFRLVDGQRPGRHLMNGAADDGSRVRSGSSARWAVTHGAGSVDWWTADAAGEAAGEVDVPIVEAVDTLGAGDAFHGAFAYASVRGPTSFAAQLRYAAGVASLRCSVVGPREWLALLGSRRGA